MEEDENVDYKKLYLEAAELAASLRDELGAERANNAEFRATFQAKVETCDILKSLATGLIQTFTEGETKNLKAKDLNDKAKIVLTEHAEAADLIK